MLTWIIYANFKKWTLENYLTTQYFDTGVVANDMAIGLQVTGNLNMSLPTQTVAIIPILKVISTKMTGLVNFAELCMTQMSAGLYPFAITRFALICAHFFILPMVSVRTYQLATEKTVQRGIKE